MGEDIELQSLENLLAKLLPIELEKPGTLFKRYMRVEENKHTQKLVIKSSIPWHAKVPWDYTSFPGMADLYSKAKAGVFYRYRYGDFDFKSLLEYSFSRVVLKTKLGFSKFGGEVGVVQCSSPQKTPEYLDFFCRYTRKNINSRTNFLYIPEVSGLIVTSSSVMTRYMQDAKDPSKIQPQLFGGEVSFEPVPLRILRMIVFHQRHYDKGKLTLAYVRKEAAEETYMHKLMAGWAMDLQNKRQVLSCMTFDLRLNRSVVHMVYTKPYANKKGSIVRYKISSDGKAGTDIIIRKKNALIGWNFEVNLLPLTQKESFGLLKFGVRLENVYEKLFSDTL